MLKVGAYKVVESGVCFLFFCVIILKEKEFLSFFYVYVIVDIGVEVEGFILVITVYVLMGFLSRGRYI